MTTNNEPRASIEPNDDLIDEAYIPKGIRFDRDGVPYASIGPSAPGYYASDVGGMARIDIKGVVQPMKSCHDALGYAIINLRVHGKPKRFYVHRLVAEAWLGPKPPEATQCRHLNSIRDDNRVGNLLWGNAGDVRADKIENNLDDWHSGRLYKHQKLKPLQVLEIRSALADGRSEVALAKQFGVNRTTIRAIHRGKTWKGVVAP